MAIEYAILGLVSLRPLSGYDIKKIFAGTEALNYSDNNNQIYRALLKLHSDQLVSREVINQENHPARKVYSITPQGEVTLKQWVLSTSDLPRQKNDFLLQLAWADRLDSAELDHVLDRYEEELAMMLLLCRAEQHGGEKIHSIQETYIDLSLARTKREGFLWAQIQQNWIDYYENELKWIRNLRQGLARVGE